MSTLENNPALVERIIAIVASAASGGTVRIPIVALPPAQPAPPSPAPVLRQGGPRVPPLAVVLFGAWLCAAPARAQRLGPVDIYPRADLTPGATNPAVTPETINRTICNPHWSTKSIRPPAHYTTALKRQQIRAYGYADHNLRDYEEDHLISLELGGAPRDPKNLWPEPYTTTLADGGAKVKDRVENFLHKEVCSGAINLRTAQHEIATDWYRVYREQIETTQRR